MKKTDFTFIEDARKHRKPMLAFTIFFYICSAGLASNIVFSFIMPDAYREWRIKMLLLLMINLIFAIYFTWCLLSRYLKYFMYIDEQEIKFYSNKKTHCYKVSDLKKYTLIKVHRRYDVIQLDFKDNASHMIFSFKAKQFKAALDKILSDF